MIGNATLHDADCFDVLPRLSGIGAVVTEPPYGIGVVYQSYDDALGNSDDLMPPGHARTGPHHGQWTRLRLAEPPEG